MRIVFFSNPLLISFAALFKSVNAPYCMCKRIGSLETQTHHMLILEFNICCKLCEGTITMMDDFINQVRHEETCSTCTSEKAITAKIIRRCMQMSALSFLTISPNAIFLLLFKLSDWLIVIQPADFRVKFRSTLAWILKIIRCDFP